MIARLRELLDEALDILRAARALPHVIEHSKALELRVIALEGRAKQTHSDLELVTDACRANGAVVSELYLSPPRDAEVRDG